MITCKLVKATIKHESNYNNVHRVLNFVARFYLVYALYEQTVTDNNCIGASIEFVNCNLIFLKDF